MKQLDIDGIKIEWLGHATVRIRDRGNIIYIDPYQIKETNDKADIVLITHEHYDHCSPADLKKVVKKGTIVMITPNGVSKISGIEGIKIEVVSMNKEYKIGDYTIETVPAYNVNKFRSPGVPFHMKGDVVGYVINIRGKKIYHASDTDFIKEMLSLKDIDVAFVPVGGTYTMDAKEAAEAVNSFKPKIAVPMHYGTIVGSIEDAERFKKLVGRSEVVILEKVE